MSRYARIAITLPRADLASADRLARAQKRPRSWIIAEALRRFAGAAPAPVGQPRPQFSQGLGESRLAQLRQDMALTPEARVRAAEETLRLTERTRRPRTRHVIAFDRFEDFVDWKRARDRVG